MPVEYTLEAEDVASARLLAIGIRPPLEFSLFAAALAGLLALSVSPWRLASSPLLVGLTAGLAAYRLMQISRVRQAAVAAFNRNYTLREVTVASWDEDGITIQPLTAMMERIPWSALERVKENRRIVLFQQKSGAIHAVPKRAFPDKAALAALRRKARAELGRGRPR
ncbi:MAG TPA: YcxB family protein [Steroidobacteraceae bacterium]|nr:YcxB family protein [Steroidobacteraceae bacterium]